MILPEGDSERAAIALDLGAHDILYEPVDAQELAIRIRAQLGRKRAGPTGCAPRWQAGLDMAVTDSPDRAAQPPLRHVPAVADAGPLPERRLAVMLLDIDHFKQVNDTHGHFVGDQVLTLVARRLRAQVRAGDLLARIGGEEFSRGPARQADRTTALAPRRTAARRHRRAAFRGGRRRPRPCRSR